MIQSYTFEDLQKMQRIQTKQSVFVFDANTRDLEFVDLSRNENLREIRFESPQPKLRYLDASYCGLEKITFSKDCRQLQTLYLHHNNLEKIEFEAKFNELSLLDLSFNAKLQNVSFQKHLPQLTYLYLHACDLRNLEHLARYFVKADFDFNIEKNRKIKAPAFEMVEQGKASVKTYFEGIYKSQEKGEDLVYLYEAKLMILGEGGAGKTSFARKVKDEKAELPKEEDRTRGIEVVEWDFDFDDEDGNNQNCYVHLWDLGGQNLYRGTHQLFFSPKSLYVLLAENRKENTDFNYWLNSVQQLGGKQSRVFLVINKRDGGQEEFNDEIHDKYKGMIKEEVAINLLGDIEGIKNVLQKKLKKQVKDLLEMGDKVVPAWLAVRKSLLEIKKKELKKFITYADFCQTCIKNDIKDKETIELLINYFDRVGVLTHISEEGLNELVYLDSNWLLKLVYKILDNDIVQASKGRITQSDITQIWEQENEEIGHGASHVRRLLNHFGLMYHIAGTKNYVVPEKLPDTCPYSSWEHSQEEAILQFRYTFDNHMPKGLMPRIIVSLHHHIKKHQNVWKMGFNIENEGTFSEIKKSDNYNHFEIRVVGANKRVLLSKIRERIDKILAEFEKLDYGEEIPCICQTCKVKGTTPHFFKNSVLEKAKTLSQVPPVQCLKSFEMIKVECLLEGVEFNQTKKGEFMMEDRKEKQEIDIFVSYSSKDRNLRKLLFEGIKEHLHTKKGFKYTLWNDTAIDLGANWKDEIEKALEKSKVALLLISASFASSEFINRDELTVFFKKQKSKGYLILPVLVREYEFSEFEKLSALNFFKTYFPEYGFNNPLVANNLLPFDELAEGRNITGQQLNRYYKTLTDFIHRAVSNHFGVL